MTSLSTLPGFLAYFALALVLLAAATWIFVQVTPQNEFVLIRQGNTGAAIVLAGVVIGFAQPIGGSIRYSANIVDMLVWAVVAVVAQITVFFIVAKLLGPDWRAAMETRGDLAGPLLKAGASIGVGYINAACLAT